MVLTGIEERSGAEETSVTKHTIYHRQNNNCLQDHRILRTPLHKPCHVATRFEYAEAHLDKETVSKKENCGVTKERWNLLDTVTFKKIWHVKGEAFLNKNSYQQLYIDVCQ